MNDRPISIILITILLLFLLLLVYNTVVQGQAIFPLENQDIHSYLPTVRSPQPVDDTVVCEEIARYEDGTWVQRCTEQLGYNRMRICYITWKDLQILNRECAVIFG